MALRFTGVLDESSYRSPLNTPQVPHRLRPCWNFLSTRMADARPLERGKQQGGNYGGLSARE